MCQLFSKFKLYHDVPQVLRELTWNSIAHECQCLLFQCLNLEEEDLSQREVDFIDIVNDPVDESRYKESEVYSLYKWVVVTV